METIQWYYFKLEQPEPGDAIIVEDHEGNQAVGAWVDEFVNTYNFPMGKLIKWSPITLYVHSLNYYECAAYYHNGVPIHLPLLYDDKPLFSDLNP